MRCSRAASSALTAGQADAADTAVDTSPVHLPACMRRAALFLVLGLGAVGVVVWLTLSTTVGASLLGLAVLGAIGFAVDDENPPGTYGP